MTEGEEFIAIFLEESGIEYRQEELIEDLTGDSKDHRKADFYLPRYNMYIEYFGQWNSENQKARYREKRKVYIDNKIPCIILYPENLGILDFVFHKRIEYVFNRYKMEKERRKYYFDLIKTDLKDRFAFIIFGFVWIYFVYDSEEGLFENYWLLFGIIFIGYQVYKIFKFLSGIRKGINPYDPTIDDEEY